MKIIALWNNYGTALPENEELTEPAVCWLSDSCLLREGRPFYVPDFDDDFRLFPSLAIRIDRLGKGIGTRFAYRYWNHVSLWLNARACSMSRRLSRAGLPQAAAVAFDCSLVAAPFFEVTPEESSDLAFVVCRNGEPVCRWESTALRMGPDEAVSAMSRHNTLKTGDIILLGFPEQGVAVSPGDRIEVMTERAPFAPKALTGFKIK